MTAPGKCLMKKALRRNLIESDEKEETYEKVFDDESDEKEDKEAEEEGLGRCK